VNDPNPRRDRTQRHENRVTISRSRRLTRPPSAPPRLDWAGATPAGPKLAWVGFHALFIGLLATMPNDLTLGGAPYQWGFGFAVFVNTLAFACVANSNPGYVDEREAGDRPLDVERAEAREEDTRDPPDHDAKGKAPVMASTTAATRADDKHDDEDGETGLLGLPGGASNSSTARKGGGDDEGGSGSGSGGGGVASPEVSDEAWTPPGGQVCKHCDAWQGLRTKHCHECGRCVRKFDHHCFWVGTCVGEKNHARFTTYLGTQTALIVWAFHISNTGVRYQQTFTELFEKNAGPVFMSFALFLFILFVGGLFGFHVYCMLTAQTTWEVQSRRKISYLRGVPENVHPFDRGPTQNAKEFCCLPPPPRYVMRPMDELQTWSKTETMWDNRYYVCC